MQQRIPLPHEAYTGYCGHLVFRHLSIMPVSGPENKQEGEVWGMSTQLTLWVPESLM